MIDRGSKGQKGLFGNGANGSVYTMPAGTDFLANLAQGLHRELGDRLHQAVILLPTRRALRELSTHFNQLAGGRPMLMPIMRTVSDMDENEPPFIPPASNDPSQSAAHLLELSIPPAMDEVRYGFELARLIAHKMSASDDPISAASALAMSAPLMQILTDLDMEELEFEALSALDDKLDSLPEHLQGAAEFVKIIAQHWPHYLSEQGLKSPMGRRVALLNACCDLWQNTPPTHPVIIAGSTGSVRATARLIKTVSQLPQGLVVLPGVDTDLDETAWDGIDEQHPQFALKNLLVQLDVDRAVLPNWPTEPLPFGLQVRARILAESLIPADTTSDWPARIESVRNMVSREDALQRGFDGVSMIAARSDEEEASVIAFILREILETPDKTGALITPDPSLARRVRAKLSRFGVEIDSSAGEPLEESHHGALLAQSLALALDPFNPSVLCDLIAHEKFCHIDDPLRPDQKRAWGRFEKTVLRGARPNGLTEIKTRIEARKPSDDELALLAQGQEIYVHVQSHLTRFQTDTQNAKSVAQFAIAHSGLIERLCGGAVNLWHGEAGEKSAQVFEDMIRFGDLLPEVDGAAYQQFLSQFMRTHVVRPRFGTDERIRILGPLEARMIRADVLVLGGLNEGIWPTPPAPHPVLSRDMRTTIGLSSEEKRFGLAAHDFSQAAMAPRVFMTRAERSGDQPAVPSRWLWRLSTFAKGAQNQMGEAENSDPLIDQGEKYLRWVRELDRAPAQISPANPPEPRPPVADRWPKGRGLSVTKVKTWVRDPYAIYASQILGLRSLDGLDEDSNARNFGTGLHAAFEKIDEYRDSKNPLESLQNAMKEELGKIGFGPSDFARYDVRLKNMAIWMLHWADTRYDAGWRMIGIEEKRRLEIKTKTMNEVFTLSGISDRIEVMGNAAAIFDYKTGVLPGKKEVLAGFDPQLPLLALLLERGQTTGKSVYTKDKNRTPEMIAYIKPNDRNEAKRISEIEHKEKSVADLGQDALDDLIHLIELFDDKDTAYYSQPRSKYTNSYGDYDQLARLAEWARDIDGSDDQGNRS